MKTFSTIRPATLLLAITALATTQAAAQEVARVAVSPATLSLAVGETATVSAIAYDAAGNVVDIPFLYFSRGGRGSLAVDRATGEIEAFKGGEFEVMARAMGPGRISGTIPSPRIPPLDRVEISQTAGVLRRRTKRHKPPYRRGRCSPTLRRVEQLGRVRRETSTDRRLVAHHHGRSTRHSLPPEALVATKIRYEVRQNRVSPMAVEQSDPRADGDVSITHRDVPKRGGRRGRHPLTFGPLMSRPQTRPATADSPPAEVDDQGRSVRHSRCVQRHPEHRPPALPTPPSDPSPRHGRRRLPAIATASRTSQRGSSGGAASMARHASPHERRSAHRAHTFRPGLTHAASPG